MTATFAFLGEHFHVPEQVSSLAFMRFAKLAKAGVDTDDVAGLAGMYDLLEQCVAPEDWSRFEQHADRQRASADQLLKVIQDVFALLADRPTSPQSASQAGLRITEPSSTAASSSPDTSERVIGRLNEKGRPDLALMVRRRQESLAASA